MEDLKKKFTEELGAPKFTTYSKIADSLILPGIIDFTRFGYWRNKRKWRPINSQLTDKHFVITGARRGIGFCAAKQLADMGAALTLVVRKTDDVAVLKDTIVKSTNNENIAIEVADLSLMSQVNKLINRLVEKDLKIDALINNAGALINPRQETFENLEQSFALLLLSPYKLTLGLKKLLQKSAQPIVVNVVSGGMYTQRLQVDELIMSAKAYSGSIAYARAKRALMVVTEYWANAWQNEGFIVNAMHPGWADTPGVQTSLPTFRKVMKRVLRNPSQGADTIVWLTAAREAGLITGKLFLDREPRDTHLLKSTIETDTERQNLIEFLNEFK